MATPLRIIHLDAVPSTMEEARARFDGVPTLVTASRQIRGRGRSGNQWVHADRAIAASLAAVIDWEPDDRGVVPLMAGLAAAGVLDVALKWPNDLVHGDEKVGGILVEAVGDVVVVGLGVNLFWPRPVEGAGALFSEDPGQAAAVDLAERWASGLVERLQAGPESWGRDEYERVCSTIGVEITWDPGGRGVARGVDDRGRLVAETPDGVAVLDSGAVRHVRTG